MAVRRVGASVVALVVAVVIWQLVRADPDQDRPVEPGEVADRGESTAPQRSAATASTAERERLGYRVESVGELGGQVEQEVQPLDADATIARTLQVGGRVVPRTDSFSHAVSWMRESDTHWIWLSRLVGHEPDGSPLLERVDAVLLPAFMPPAYVTLDDCQWRSDTTVEVVALADFSGGASEAEGVRASLVSAAWAIDLRTEQLVSVDAGDVTCLARGA